MHEIMPAPEVDETVRTNQEMTVSSLSLSTLFYVAAINFGADAINRLSHDTSVRSLGYFAGEVIVSGLAAAKGISHLEDYLNTRKISKAEAPQTTPALPLQ